MSKNSSTAINWITGAAAAYFIGTAIAGAIKRKREQGAGGIGANRKSPRRIWHEVSWAQSHGIDLTNADAWQQNIDMLRRPAEQYIKTEGEKPKEQRYFNQLRRAYKSIAGTGLPSEQTVVRNEYGDVILIYNDYHLDKLPESAAMWILEENEQRFRGGENEAYWVTIADIALGRVKFVWKSDGVRRGVEQLLFGSSAPAERKARISYIATREKGAVYPETFAHNLWESFGANDEPSDLDCLNGVLDALRECQSVGQAREICIDAYLKAHNVSEPVLFQEVPF